MNTEHQKTILLVEDDPVTIMLESNYLKKSGFKVISAKTAEEAIKLTDNQSDIDMVLMDIELGEEMDGIFAAREILGRHDLPLIFISSHTEKAIVEKTESISSYGYILKNSGERVFIASVKMAFKLFEEKLKVQLTERELRKSEEEFRLIAENTSDGIIVIENGKVTYVSPAYIRILGYSVEEELSRTEENIRELMHPAERKTAIDVIYQAINQQKKNIVYTFRAKHKNGNYIWREDNATFIYDNEGKHIKSYVIARDISERVQAQEELLRSQSRYQGLVENLNDLVFLITADGLIQYVSSAISRLFGYEPDELTGKSFHSFIHPEDLNMISSALLDILNKRIHPSEYRIHTKSGEIRWVRSSSTPLYEDGRIIGIQGILSDITEQKIAEKALRESEQRNKALLNALPDLMFLLDENGAFIDYHAPDEDELLIKPESFLGKRADELVPGYYADIITKQIIEVKEKGSDIQQYNLEIKNERRVFESRMVPCAENYMVIIRDITQQQKLTEQIRLSEKKYHDLYESVPIGLYQSTPDGKILEANTAFLRLSGIDVSLSDSWMKQDMRKSYVNPEDALKLRELLQKNGFVNGFEAEFLRNDGVKFWLSNTAVICRDFDGYPYVINGSFIDITERKKAERLLLESERKYRNLAEDMPVFITTFDENLRVIYANKRLSEFSNTAVNDLTGQRFTDFLSQQDRQKVEDILHSLTPDNSCESHEQVYYDGEGNKYYQLWMNRAFFDENGKVTHYQAIGQDITNRKKDEEEKILKTLVLNQIQDMVTITDLNGRIIYVNDAEIRKTGYSKEQLIGSSNYIYGDNSEKGATQAEILSETINKGYWRGEIVNYTTEGREMVVDCRTTVVYDNNRNPIALCGIGTDVTERKQLEMSLRESELQTRNKLKAIMEPEGNLGDLSLEDIFDIQELQSMMEDFYSVTGIGIGIIDRA